MLFLYSLIYLSLVQVCVNCNGSPKLPLVAFFLLLFLILLIMFVVILMLNVGVLPPLDSWLFFVQVRDYAYADQYRTLCMFIVCVLCVCVCVRVCV